MLTIFSIPKPFTGHIAVIQENGIRSWKLLGDGVRIVLFGDESGTAEAASRIGVEHEPAVARNEYGTPLLDDLFHRAQERCDDRSLCYVNADIILLSNCLAAIKRVVRTKRRFLMIGQRIDLDVIDPIEFTSDWEDRLRLDTEQRGVLHRPTGIDYFVFSRNLWDRIPPFAIGRFSWDNWLIWRARSLKVPVIDATAVVTAIHQNHDYSHAGGLKSARDGPEAKRNFRLAGGRERSLTIWDSTHVLTGDGLRPRAFDAALGGGVWSYRRAVG